MPSSPTKAPPFPHRRAGHCGSGALRDLLEFHRLDYGAVLLDDADLRALSGIYGVLSSLWRSLALHAERDHHAGGLMAVEQIAALEHLGVSLMETWLGKNSK